MPQPTVLGEYKNNSSSIILSNNNNNTFIGVGLILDCLSKKQKTKVRNSNRLKLYNTILISVYD